MPWPSRCWQRKREPSGGLAGSQDPVCLEQGLEPGGHFSLQGLTAWPSRREHVNTSRAGQWAGKEEGIRRPQLLSPVAALDSKSGQWGSRQLLPVSGMRTGPALSGPSPGSPGWERDF